MKDVLVADAPVQGLEYVFVPPGLPLIAKTTDKPATTSILVRGGAGTGKTTLALSLVHSIAREHGGTALYLTTEFVPTELVYKGRMLGLAEGVVVARGATGELSAGAVEAEHLSRTAAGKDVATSAERKRAAIEAVWELLSSQREGGAAQRLRAVAIDGFGLPEGEVEERALRNDLLTLIQALEVEGISVVLVEEVGPGAGAWLPFVVDIVFELALMPDPDTGELSRRLTCPKSRYARALPGPHDYGMEGAIPAVWPNPVPIVAERAFEGAVKPVDLFFPFAEHHYVSEHRGLLMLIGEHGDPPIKQAVLRTAGTQVARVQCGAVTRIVVEDSADGRVTTPFFSTTEGPFAWGWALLRAARRGKINTVFIRDLDLHTPRSRSRRAIMDVLAALRDLGLLVYLEDSPDALAPLFPLADHVARTKQLGWRSGRSLPLPRPRSALSWLVDLWEFPMKELPLGVPIDARAPPSAKELKRMRSQFGAGYLDMSELEKLTPEKASGIKFSSDAQIERATALHHLGLVGDARSLLTQYTRPAHLAPRRAVLQMLLGREIEAAQTLLAMPEDSFERVSVLWHGLCALLGRNDAALERLRRDPKDNPLSLGLFLRALAVRGEFKDTDAIVSAQAAMNGWPPWFQNRIHADLRLDSGSSESEILEEARKRLNRLANTGGMPPIHLADVLFNLAVAWDWIGHSKNAKAAYKGALQLNPHLEPAKERLEALG